MAKFSLKFWTIAAGLHWPEDCLRILYRRALNPEIQDELMSWGSTLDLLLTSFEDFIGLSVTIDNSIRERRRCRTRAPALTVPVLEERPEPRQLGRSPLMSTERTRRLSQGLCLYCGEIGRTLHTCKVHLSRPEPPTKVGKSIFLGLSQPQLTFLIELSCMGRSVSARALIDSGAAGNFMGQMLAQHLQVPIRALSTPISVLGVFEEGESLIEQTR